jgi:hypothetical protein
VFSAREFVWWYNGHPDGVKLPVDLSRVQSVAVCGIGNVAVDCARVLLRPPSELAGTEIAGAALRQLQGSSAVQQVRSWGRRALSSTLPRCQGSSFATFPEISPELQSQSTSRGSDFNKCGACRR